ncbi:MAG: type II secretion system minor pseudopilin GspI [Nitrospirota bacterium]
MGRFRFVPSAQGGLLRQPRGTGRCTSAPSAQCGFTLLEIMVALAIIGVAFVALLGLRNRDIVLHERGRAMIQATALAQQRMGEVLVGTYPDVGTSEGQFEDEQSRFAWRQEVQQTPFEFVREVRVTVTWDPPHNERVDLVSYVFQRSAQP